MQRPSSLTKCLALWLSVVLSATNVVFAHKPQLTLWGERRIKNNDHQTAKIENGKSKIEVVLPYGSVRKILNAQASNSKTIIHIQDVHSNLEAQRNIAGAVRALVESGQVGVIGLEGAIGEIDLSPFQTYPRRESVKKVADYLLKQNQISGPIYALFTASAQAKVVGVDDPVHYQANIQAYRDAVPKIKKNKEKLIAAQHNSAERKQRIFSADLLTFDRHVEAYRAGTLSMGAYIRSLPAFRRGEIRRSSLAVFLKTLQLESSLNFSRVETERTQLLSYLVPRLSKADSAGLMDASAAYRAGSMPHTDFYRTLEKLCAKNGVPLARFPAMSDYLRYVLLADRIDAEELIQEVNDLEKQTYEALAKTVEEKNLIAESRRLYLTGKLLDFALTKEEWGDYKQFAIDDLRLTKKEVVNLKSFEDFYREAEVRDQKITENFINNFHLRKSSIENQKSAVLVTGGFHSSGIDEKLANAGYTVITFTPKITKIDTASGSTYLSVFNQEKAPLEKLFEGQKLFLAQSPYASDVRFAAAGYVAAHEEIDNGPNRRLLSETLADIRVRFGLPFQITTADIGPLSSEATLATANAKSVGKMRCNSNGDIESAVWSNPTVFYMAAGVSLLISINKFGVFHPLTFLILTGFFSISWLNAPAKKFKHLLRPYISEPLQPYLERAVNTFFGGFVSTVQKMRQGIILSGDQVGISTSHFFLNVMGENHGSLSTERGYNKMRQLVMERLRVVTGSVVGQGMQKVAEEIEKVPSRHSLQYRHAMHEGFIDLIESLRGNEKEIQDKAHAVYLLFHNVSHGYLERYRDDFYRVVKNFYRSLLDLIESTPEAFESNSFRDKEQFRAYLESVGLFPPDPFDFEIAALAMDAMGVLGTVNKSSNAGSNLLLLALSWRGTPEKVLACATLIYVALMEGLLLRLVVLNNGPLIVSPLGLAWDLFDVVSFIFLLVHAVVRLRIYKDPWVIFSGSAGDLAVLSIYSAAGGYDFSFYLTIVAILFHVLIDYFWIRWSFFLSEKENLPGPVRGPSTQEKSEKTSAPVAVLLELEALPFETVDNEHGDKHRVVSRETRTEILRYLKAGCPVGILTHGPDDWTTENDEDVGLRPMFVQPFIEDLKAQKGNTGDWLSNLRLYAGNSMEMRIAANIGVYPASMGPYSLRKIKAHNMDFVNPSAVYQELKKKIAALQLQLSDRDISYSFNRYDINLKEALPNEDVKKTLGEIESCLGQNALSGEVVLENPNKIVVRSAVDRVPLKWFAAFASERLGATPGEYLVIDKGDLRSVNVLDGPRVRYATGPLVQTHENKKIVTFRRSSDQSFFSSARYLLDAVAQAHLSVAKKTPATPAELWSEPLESLADASLETAMIGAFGKKPPHIIVSELNESLVAASEKVDEGLIQAVIDYLSADPTNVFALFSSAPLKKNGGGDLTIQEKFLKPLMEAAGAERADLFNRVWAYAEGGAVKLKYVAKPGETTGGFLPEDEVKLPPKRSEAIQELIGKWKDKRFVALAKPVVTQTEYCVKCKLNLPEGSQVTVSNLATSLQAYLQTSIKNSRLKVQASGGDRLVINLRSKRMAENNFRQDLGKRDTGTLYFTSYYKPSPPFDIEEGLVVYHHEQASLTGAAVMPEPVPASLKLSEVARVLRDRLSDVPPETLPEPAVARQEKLPADGQLYKPVADKPIGNTFDSFHATEKLQWILKDPPKVLYLFSGGGGGDIKSVSLLALMLKDLFKRHKDTSAGANFVEPEIVLVDSTVKHKFENTYGGPMPIEKLFYRPKKKDGRRSTKRKEEKLSTKPYFVGTGDAKKFAKHFYIAQPDMFVRYEMPDENKNRLNDIELEYTWTVGHAVENLRKTEIDEKTGKKKKKKSGIKVLIMDSSQSAQALADDLHQLTPDMAAIMGDVGGDIVGRHRSLHRMWKSATSDEREEVEHEESWVCSGVSDLASVLLAKALGEKLRAPDKKVSTSIWLIGAGLDGEMYINLPRYLKRLLDRGGILGVWDFVHYFLQASVGAKDGLAMLERVLKLRISTESSNKFIELLIYAVRHGIVFFDQLMELGVSLRQCWRLFFSPNFSALPMIPLRSGTRPGLALPATLSAVVMDTDMVFNDLVVPVPVKDGKKTTTYKRLHDVEPFTKTWWQLDAMVQDGDATTESNERDHHGNSVRRAFDLMVACFTQGKASGERDGDTWRVKADAYFPVEAFETDAKVQAHYLHHPSAVIRLAALAALGPNHWEQTETKIWEIIENAGNNAFLIGVAFIAMSYAGADKTSTQIERISATRGDVHHRLNWEEDPFARSLDRTFIQNGAIAAYNALAKSTPIKNGKQKTVDVPPVPPIEDVSLQPRVFVMGVRPSPTWFGIISLGGARLLRLNPSLPDDGLIDGEPVTMINAALSQAELAAEKRRFVSARVGAVISDGKEILGKGYNGSAFHAEHHAVFAFLKAQIDRTNLNPVMAEDLHARIDALLAAAQKVSSKDKNYSKLLRDTVLQVQYIRGCLEAKKDTYPAGPLTIYVTMEACDKCPKLLAAAGISRAVFLSEKANGGGWEKTVDEGIDVVWMSDRRVLQRARGAHFFYYAVGALRPEIHDAIQWLGTIAGQLHHRIRQMTNGNGPAALLFSGAPVVAIVERLARRGYVEKPQVAPAVDLEGMPLNLDLGDFGGGHAGSRSDDAHKQNHRTEDPYGKLLPIIGPVRPKYDGKIKAGRSS